jgi:hypothetical protein
LGPPAAFHMAVPTEVNCTLREFWKTFTAFVLTTNYKVELLIT